MSLSPLDALAADQHEAVLFCQDKASGLRGYIALHNTRLGPGLGGCRMMAYPSEEAALQDVLKLSKAMTYKNALAGLDYGGGKGVIIIDHPEQKTPELIEAFARRIDLLRGSYFTATDIGSTSDDMKRMKAITPYISALSIEDGGLGDSSILTGYGVFQGIRAGVKHQLGLADLKGLRVAVQGAGKVASHLTGHLLEAGCEVIVTDIYEPALQALKARYPQVQTVEPDQFFQEQVDVISPNAIGGTIDEKVAEITSAKVIAGGANNALAHDGMSQILKEAGILFIPDFVISSGGVITLAYELNGGTLEEAKAKTEGIYDTALKVVQRAESKNLTPLEAAISLANDRIQFAGETTSV